jgi:hypothetical protein
MLIDRLLPLTDSLVSLPILVATSPERAYAELRRLDLFRLPAVRLPNLMRLWPERLWLRIPAISITHSGPADHPRSLLAPHIPSPPPRFLEGRSHQSWSGLTGIEHPSFTLRPGDRPLRNR